jgi:hypothetical protein
MLSYHRSPTHKSTTYGSLSYRSRERTLKKQMVVDTRRRATAPAFFVYLTKRAFSRLGETKILLESPSSNLRELEIPN